MGEQTILVSHTDDAWGHVNERGTRRQCPCPAQFHEIHIQQIVGSREICLRIRREVADERYEEQAAHIERYTEMRIDEHNSLTNMHNHHEKHLPDGSRIRRWASAFCFGPGIYSCWPKIHVCSLVQIDWLSPFCCHFFFIVENSNSYWLSISLSHKRKCFFFCLPHRSVKDLWIWNWLFLCEFRLIFDDAVNKLSLEYSSHENVHILRSFFHLNALFYSQKFFENKAHIVPSCLFMCVLYVYAQITITIKMEWCSTTYTQSVKENVAFRRMKPSDHELAGLSENW